MSFENVTGPAVWSGASLWERATTHYRLSDAENQALRRRLAASSSLPLNSLEKADFAHDDLTPIYAMARDELEHGSGVFRLRGLSLDHLTEDEIARIFWGIARQIGTPVSQSAKGELIFRVQDQGYRMGQAAARGPNTRKGLSFHTDRCDVIAFCCVRQAIHGGENLLASAATLHNEILAARPDLLEVLYQPFTWQRHNVDTGNHKPWCQLPVFAPHKGKFMANIMRVLIERGHQRPDVPELTGPQREALDYLETTARRPEIHTEFRQEPGDLLFVNNLIVFHSRREFEDAQNPARKRLLLRLWLATPTSRELDPVYAGLYGTHRAGTTRGGMHPPGGRPAPEPCR